MFAVVRSRFFCRFGVHCAGQRMADSRPRPCVLCGPSGSGKSTLIKKLMEEYKDYFGFSVSHTTRKPRPGEQDGIHYHYTTREWMENAITNGEFIESAEFSGNLYGTSKKAVQDVLNQNKICILDIEMQGVIQIQKTNLKPVYIFVKPPNMKVLEERLRNRKTDTEEAIQKRLETARREMDFISQQEGSTGHTIVNDCVDLAYLGLKAVLLDEIQRLGEARDLQKT
ncbi:guanylate kinase-like isoform X2 [Acanthaster planci]|uniref:guanylate kinase n=1 Tax=Acanthaster planci TaxID=133434 RepID=A0A8B7XET5_ACAPL|nr:guanylate kinase-like isoform X2 [Acanthaster planci]XP_022079269.1 guanylate kinase-like isoform X2 [Acanthaster planci]